MANTIGKLEPERSVAAQEEPRPIYGIRHEWAAPGFVLHFQPTIKAARAMAKRRQDAQADGTHWQIVRILKSGYARHEYEILETLLNG